MSFLSTVVIRRASWQAFERAVERLLICEGFEGVRRVGQAGDQGADIIGHRAGKRWLVQVKHWKRRVGVDTVDATLRAMVIYRAQVPMIVALNGFDDGARQHQVTLHARGVPLQLLGPVELERRGHALRDDATWNGALRSYQEQAAEALVRQLVAGKDRRASIVMATGLGKTITAFEALRRIRILGGGRYLVVAHTNELVYQLERAMWPFLRPSDLTVVLNGYERPTTDQLASAAFAFVCLPSGATAAASDDMLPRFDGIVVDECHHAASPSYVRLLQATGAGMPGGPFVIGLTATPWRSDRKDLRELFGLPVAIVDMVDGLRQGFLSNVDYRLFTDNIRWSSLRGLRGERFSPRQINRTLFISEWDDAVVLELQRVWNEVAVPRAIVFCGTIDHAITMRDRINSLGFCNAAAIYSRSGGVAGLTASERSRILCDFQDNVVNVLCAVDILNEGIDVPDVNIIVFQRVTHSRRIFVQQLGRGLRLSEGKEKVVVLDFVSDIRRVAAAIDLKDQLAASGSGPTRIRVDHKVEFRRAGAPDARAEGFLRAWLEDIAAIELADEDASVLRFPPALEAGLNDI